MRHLYLLRHATTEDHGREGDASRELTATGEREAAILGAHLASQAPLPVRILHSPARRVDQTLRGLRDGAPEALAGIPAEAVQALYLGTPDHILAAIATTPPEFPAILVIAHNPGLSDLAQMLVGSAEDEAVGCLGKGFRPATLMHLRFDVEDWSELRPGKGRLIHCSNAVDR